MRTEPDQIHTADLESIACDVLKMAYAIITFAVFNNNTPTSFNATDQHKMMKYRN